MGSRRVAAHPLVVAAAFGLIGPAAFDEGELSSADDGFVDTTSESHESTVDPSEFHRVEQAWLAVRDLALTV